jgi:hypothetical protein
MLSHRYADDRRAPSSAAAEHLYQLLTANHFAAARHVVKTWPASNRVRLAVSAERYQDAICDLGHQVIPQDRDALAAAVAWPPAGKFLKAIGHRVAAPHTLNLV